MVPFRSASIVTNMERSSASFSGGVAKAITSSATCVGRGQGTTSGGMAFAPCGVARGAGRGGSGCGSERGPF
eukprot:scaffold4498_cov119-Isochrysis_galbana.AAC.5